MSTIIKADANGTVTLPAELCQAAGLAPGADLVAEVRDGSIVLHRPRRPIWQRLADEAAQTPAEESNKLPADGAAQIDHYLYGHPKRPE
jgi:antitoxin component of MazEF toxin-antitoxin module